MTELESRFIDGPAGRLDSRWHGLPKGGPVLLLHPHPQFGGTMGSRLVYDLAIELASTTHRVVRFDFRGVGRSDGTYDQGRGETLDAAALWDALEQETGKPPAVVGYSFGGGIATRLATIRPVPNLVLIGTQPRVFQSELAPVDDAGKVQARAQLIVGTEDEFVSVEETRDLAARFRPRASVSVIPGAGHFLEPSMNFAAVSAVQSALRLPRPA